jgi:hypothetical protein
MFQDLFVFCSFQLPYFFPSNFVDRLIEVVTDPKQDLMPLVASLVLHTKDGDVTVSMGQLGPPYDPGNVAIPISCPPKPGKYSLYIVWGGATSYIAHAEVIVVPR